MHAAWLLAAAHTHRQASSQCGSVGDKDMQDCGCSAEPTWQASAGVLETQQEKHSMAFSLCWSSDGALTGMTA